MEEKGRETVSVAGGVCERLLRAVWEIYRMAGRWRRLTVSEVSRVAATPGEGEHPGRCRLWPSSYGPPPSEAGRVSEVSRAAP